ncbi:MAG: glycosyltransferase family 2 protein [Bacteroidales bacterium]|nr:glycosyltransferase family 2 protein [Bacteroidales bacterium]
MLSIITPVYNSEKYLARCIESVLSQKDFTDFEFICVDDGSKDQSRQILDTYGNDSRLIILEQENSGAGTARNKAINIAKGDYIMFLDSDDIISSGQNVKKAYDYASKNKLDVLLTSHNEMSVQEEFYCVVHPDTSLIGKENEKREEFFSCIFHPKDAGLGLFSIVYPGPCAKLFRREFIIGKNIRFLSLLRSEDFPFVELALAASESIGVLFIPTFNHRNNIDTSVEANKDQTPLIFHEAEIAYYRKLEESGLDEYKDASKVRSLNRLCYNLRAMKTFSGFSAIFERLPEYYEEYQIDVPNTEPVYRLYKSDVDYLSSLLNYSNAGDYLFHQYLITKKTVETLNHEVAILREKTGISGFLHAIWHRIVKN